MATTFVDYTGDGNATKAFSFPSIKEADIKVDVDGVIKTSGNHYNITSYTTTGGGNVVFTSGNIPASPAAIRIYRDTDVDAAKATFVAGSSVKAGDLNNNMTQILYAAQEEQNQTIQTTDIKDGAIISAKILDGTIATADIAADAITSAKIADDQINSEHYVDGSIDTAHIADSQITTAKIAADAINGTKIADDSINSEHYVDGSIDTAHIADGQVTHVKLANDAVDGDNISDDSINSEHYVDGSIDTAHIADSQVTTAKLASDAVTTVKITDLNVTTAKIAADAITGAKIADDAVNSEHLAADSIDAEHYAAGSVDTTALGADAVTGAKIADDAIDSEHYAADSIDSEHYAAASVDDTALASNSVTTSKITDANVTTVKVADSNITLAKLASDLKQTSISDSDTQLPTSGAVVDYVAAQLQPFGGFEAIATEVAFPNTQPVSGVIISISDAAGVVVNGSGTSTTGRTVGGSTVTINNFPSSLNSETLASGVGLMVSSTGSSQTYNYHKILAAETDVKQLSDDINDFNARYRVNAGEPGSSNDQGDLVFDTNASKMKVYDGSSWGEVTSTGDFKYLFLCPAGGSGAPTLNGSIATYDLRESSNSGSAASVSSAAQLVVSVNGVIQKANTGTSAPAEGFALVDANTIIFGANLASGDSVFIVQIGSAVSIPTPGDGTVSAAKIASGAVTTAKIADANVTTAKIADDAVTAAKLASDAVVTASIVDANVTTAKIAGDAITGAKIADDAIDSEHYTDGSIDTAHIADLNVTTGKLAADAVTGAKIADDAVGAEHIEQLDADLSFADNVNASFGASADLTIDHNGTHSIIDNNTGRLYVLSDDIWFKDKDDGDLHAKFVHDGAVELYHDGSKRLSTWSDSVNIYGDEGQAAILHLYADDGDDNADKWRVQSGTSSDFYIQNYASGSWETSIDATANGNVRLMYDNSVKFETTSAGATVTGTITDSKGDVRSIPLNTQTGAYTLVAADAGKTVYISAGGVTINENVFSAGDAVTIINNSSSDQTLTEGSGSMVLYNTADGTFGSRTLAGRGMCTLYWATASNAYISGSGLS